MNGIVAYSLLSVILRIHLLKESNGKPAACECIDDIILGNESRVIR